MFGKVTKLRYADNEMRDTTKFPKLEEEYYLVKTWEILPLGRPILELVQWIMELYNSDIMNLLDIPHFG